MLDFDENVLVQSSGRGQGNKIKITISESLTVRVEITSPSGNNVDTGEFPPTASAYELASWLECRADY